MVKDKLQVEYYIIPSDEVKLYFEKPAKHYLGMMPYQYNMEKFPKVITATGREMDITKIRTVKSGYTGVVEGTEKDFPLTFYYPPLTGASREAHTVELTLPQDGETVTKNLPKMDFKYGTVELLSMQRTNGEESNHNPMKPEMHPTTFVELVYRITPKDGKRQMYDVCIDVENEEASGSAGVDTGEDWYVHGRELSFRGHEIDKITLTFAYPMYWIQGDYSIVIEKPTELLDRSSAIDVESEKKAGIMSIPFYD